ncbi:MAG: hypothetical protein JRG67_05025 [Deltaproteobacteria bacterium]|nr:hypothetical protein [Deltaproteobacteria bacterium]MBW2214501.1 hypothetical protein [Deltaproteobacteria bacterium]MBW2628117.1 hypothetical protein [Deltaproteobacteria bacterium]
MDPYTEDPIDLEDVLTLKSALSVSGYCVGLKTIEEPSRIVRSLTRALLVPGFCQSMPQVFSTTERAA